MERLGSWFSGVFGQSSPAATPCQTPAVTSAVAGAAVERFHQNPSSQPPLLPPTPTRPFTVIYQEIQDSTTLDQLTPLLKEAQSLISNTAAQVDGLERRDVLRTLYNKLNNANFDTSAKTPETQLFYDKLEQAIYRAFLPEILNNPANPEYINFYSNLFSRIATSPSFSILYNPAEEFFAHFATFRQQAHVRPSEEMRNALQKELQYLSLAPSVFNRDGDLDQNRVITCITAYQAITPRDQWKTSDKLAYNLLANRYHFTPIQLSGQLLQLDIPQGTERKTFLQQLIRDVDSSEGVFNLYQTINQAARNRQITEERRTLLQEELLKKVLVYNSTATMATKASLQCLDAAIQHLATDLRRGEGLGSVIAAATFQLRAADLLKALREIIYKEALLNHELQELSKRLTLDLNRIQQIYENTADSLAEKKAFCQITSPHTQSTLPAIDMFNRETSQDTTHPGRGACLSIAAYTCNSLLRGQLQHVEDLHQAMYCGISRYQDVIGSPEEEGSHLNMENIGVFFPQILEIVPPEDAIDKSFHLAKGLEKDVFLTSLNTMAELASNRPDKKIAAAIRVRGSVFSLFLDRSTGSPLVTVADSHGLDAGAKGPAYVKTFSSLEDAATFLARAYPYQEVAGTPAPGDPLNNGEMEFLALPENGGPPIHKDLVYAKAARARTQATRYEEHLGRGPKFPNPNQTMYGKMYTILTDPGKSNIDKWKQLAADVLQPLNTANQLTGHLRKRPQRDSESQEDYLTYVVDYYTNVARHYMKPDEAGWEFV